MKLSALPTTEHPWGFYITVMDAGRVGVLAGPYSSQGEAARDQRRVTKVAKKVGGMKAIWYAYGVSRVQSAEPGLLNRKGLV